MKKPTVFSYLFGNVKKDFSLKLAPEMIRQLRARKNRTETIYTAEEEVSRNEFALRYRNIRRAYLVLIPLALLSIFQATRSELFIHQLSSYLAAALMILFALNYGFRLWVARLVFRHWGKTRDVPTTFKHYLAHCLTSPKDLLPLSLPRDR